MPCNNRDLQIISRIRQYCIEIRETHMMFNSSYEVFLIQHVYRNAVCMSLMQIGELSIHLSEEFKKQNPEIPWRQIKGMRNLFAHHYWGLETKELWKTSFGDTENLLNFCDSLLAEST